MEKKYQTISLIIFIAIITITILISNKSFAYQYNTNNEYTLFYKNNMNELKKDIKKYLSPIDDFLIPNSNFETSDILNQNYSFLVNFSIDYINYNIEKYQDRIVTNIEYNYNGLDFYNKTTNKYIKIEEIYKITDKYFGIKDFLILNDNVNIIDDYISLSDYTERQFNLKILDIQVEQNNNQLLAYISYENNCKYLYTFNNDKNILKISNIEVAE